MVQNYQRGDLLGVFWVPQTAGGQFALTVKDQDLDLSAFLWDASNTLSGGSRARLAGIQDSAATILAVYDADVSPYVLPPGGPGIVEGAGGLLLFVITTLGRNIQVPMRIEKIHWKGAIEQGMVYSFDAKHDSRVGLRVYPAA